MGAIKTGWDFFQDQILGMHWLKDLIGNLLVKAGMGESRFPGEFLHFFIYDVIKIFVLLAVLIFLILIFRVIFRRREVRRLWEDSKHFKSCWGFLSWKASSNFF